MINGTDFEFDLSPRDAAILKARVKYPEKPVSKLRDILEEEFDISLSHNRVNEILNEMRDEDVFSMRAIPNQNIFDFYLFQVAFHYSNFDENWERCYKKLLDDPHVMLFCSADDYHEWQFVAQFASPEQSEAWRHEFVREYGDFIAQIDKTAFPTVHKFETAAAVFNDLLRDMGGEEYVTDVERQAGDGEETDKVSMNQ
jgi:hypothetical protein